MQQTLSQRFMAHHQREVCLSVQFSFIYIICFVSFFSDSTDIEQSSHQCFLSVLTIQNNPTVYQSIDRSLCPNMSRTAQRSLNAAIVRGCIVQAECQLVDIAGTLSVSIFCFSANKNTGSERSSGPRVTYLSSWLQGKGT